MTNRPPMLLENTCQSPHLAIPSSLPFVGAETIGEGTLQTPAQGPAPSYQIGGAGFVLVKNWSFGSSSNSTIRNTEDTSAHFQYHDHYNNVIGGGGNYGAKIVAADATSAIKSQPIEGADGVPVVRKFESESLKTFVVPLKADAAHISVAKQDAGCGSFEAKWTLPGAGQHLGQDIIWETRVRYVPPEYFWYSHWIDGEGWHKVEIDVVESFGYDNGNDSTNYDGRFWHSEIGLGTAAADNQRRIKYGSWINGMKSVGVPLPYDASQYHVWTMLYRANNSRYTLHSGPCILRPTVDGISRSASFVEGMQSDSRFPFHPSATDRRRSALRRSSQLS